MSDEIATWVSEEILGRFDSEGVASAQILPRVDLINSPHIVDNNILNVINDETLGDVRVPRPPVQYSGKPTPTKKLAPFQGADNQELMLEMGYKNTEINQYVLDGILHQPIVAD
jgi:crotonobetainyl-CoA:carnitine CoA-transferase CaiB-like acyl-CoA transferase